MIVGIDAVNLFSGGGLTHLKNIITHFNPNNHKIEKIIVWAKNDVLEFLEDQDWLDKRTNININGGLISRYKWILLNSKKEFIEHCDILFSPGGLYFGGFRPYITMSRNMLLFDDKERKRLSLVLRYKLLLSKYFQIKSIQNAAGTIFISKYAERVISEKLSLDKGKYIRIYHGISDEKKLSDKNRSFSSFDTNHPINVLYVSSISFYKHQWNVIRAIKLLRDEGYKIILHLVGGAEPKALTKMNNTIDEINSKKEFVKYHGLQPFERIINFYRQADLFCYASTCENMPNILIEAMSSALPIACSISEPMPEFLKDAGMYFDAENIFEIKEALRKLILSVELRKQFSQKAFLLSKQYDWSKCSKATFQFIEETYKRIL